MRQKLQMGFGKVEIKGNKSESTCEMWTEGDNVNYLLQRRYNNGKYRKISYKIHSQWLLLRVRFNFNGIDKNVLIEIVETITTKILVV